MNDTTSKNNNNNDHQSDINIKLNHVHVRDWIQHHTLYFPAIWVSKNNEFQNNYCLVTKNKNDIYCFLDINTNKNIS